MKNYVVPDHLAGDILFLNEYGDYRLSLRKGHSKAAMDEVVQLFREFYDIELYAHTHDEVVFDLAQIVGGRNKGLPHYYLSIYPTFAYGEWSIEHTLEEFCEILQRISFIGTPHKDDLCLGTGISLLDILSSFASTVGVLETGSMESSRLYLLDPTPEDILKWNMTK